MSGNNVGMRCNGAGMVLYCNGMVSGCVEKRLNGVGMRWNDV